MSESIGTAGSAPTGQEAIGSAAAPAKKKFSFVRTFAGLLIFGVVALGGWWFSRDDVQNAKVGDCMPASVMDNSTDTLNGENKVDCNSAEANQKVVGIVNSKTRAEFDADQEGTMCAAFPTAESVLWIGEQGKAGTVFCLEPVKH